MVKKNLKTLEFW